MFAREAAYSAINRAYGRSSVVHAQWRQLGVGVINSDLHFFSALVSNDGPCC